MMGNVLIIQSHRDPLPATWYQICVESVRDWAARGGFEYLWLDDRLLHDLPLPLRQKTSAQPVVAADLGRLFALQRALQEGAQRVVWLDADTLVIDPDRLQLPGIDHAFGREIWVQNVARNGRESLGVKPDRTRFRVYDKIHNAFMCFSQHNPVLDFYLYAAERLVMSHDGPMVPQLIGPKFLATLHNLLRFPVVEEAAVLCPPVARDLLAADREADAASETPPPQRALQLFRTRSRATPAALNMCGSMMASGELTDAEILRVIELLQKQPELLAALS